MIVLALIVPAFEIIAFNKDWNDIVLTSVGTYHHPSTHHHPHPSLPPPTLSSPSGYRGYATVMPRLRHGCATSTPSLRRGYDCAAGVLLVISEWLIHILLEFMLHELTQESPLLKDNDLHHPGKDPREVSGNVYFCPLPPYLSDMHWTSDAVDPNLPANQSIARKWTRQQALYDLGSATGWSWLKRLCRALNVGQRGRRFIQALTTSNGRRTRPRSTFSRGTARPARHVETAHAASKRSVWLIRPPLRFTGLSHCSVSLMFSTAPFR